MPFVDATPNPTRIRALQFDGSNHQEISAESGGLYSAFELADGRLLIVPHLDLGSLYFLPNAGDWVVFEGEYHPYGWSYRFTGVVGDAEFQSLYTVSP